MASFLRQIVASPRTRHAEADLDLCYVTDNIIATSGPSQTYPQRAYRNPLDQLVKFLDSKHGDDWAIWEFRAEGTGYPDEAVYGRVRHYPWPDHHPPPFRVVPNIMASMRNWLRGGDLHDESPAGGKEAAAATATTTSKPAGDAGSKEQKKRDRVVVVHCKAGKGRSGTVSCSYLISEEGWTPEDALAQFTQRRMRPQFGAGVSIPSQLRWVSYVERWTHGGKKYFDRAIEIVEVHVWGLRNGVKVDIEGFMDEGKKIEVFHTFSKEERVVVEGDAPESNGFSDMMWELAGYTVNPPPPPQEPSAWSKTKTDANTEKNEGEEGGDEDKGGAKLSKKASIKRTGTTLIRMASASSLKKVEKVGKKSKTFVQGNSSSQRSSISSSSSSSSDSEEDEPGGMAVILKPKVPVRIPNSDINVSVERRNRTRKSLGMTMVTAVGHVWFNAYFEGNGPEQGNKPADSGVFSIKWDAMDGIKGTSRKGTRALDKMAIVWRAVGSSEGTPGISAPLGEEVEEPAEGKPVPETGAADWKGAHVEGSHSEKKLGLRMQHPGSADVSKASSVVSSELPPSGSGGEGKEKEKNEGGDESNQEDGYAMSGVKSSGPTGGRLSDEEAESDSSKKGKETEAPEVKPREKKEITKEEKKADDKEIIKEVKEEDKKDTVKDDKKDDTSKNEVTGPSGGTSQTGAADTTQTK